MSIATDLPMSAFPLAYGRGRAKAKPSGAG
jgi:hypothetical protein